MRLSRTCTIRTAMSATDLPKSVSSALTFEVLAEQGRARRAKLKLPHFIADTPMFMPVGTRGTVKGLTSKQLEDLNCHVVLGNTYHLQHQPGSDLIAEFGGLHEFINWKRGMLTDSGGFQMVSLLKLANISEEGVNFQSPVDGTPMLLTPEQSICIQNNLGADIIMQLDDVVPATNKDPARFEEATYRTTRWLDRCVQAHKRPHEQSLFPIVQGGFNSYLRDMSIQQLVERDMPGYAIGGLAGGEAKEEFWPVVSRCTAGLPSNKPRYVMGIGYPLDIVVCTALGGDMYDSVYPTRTARFGVALVPEGTLKIKNAIFADDFRPLDQSCDCLTCKRYTRAYLHSIIASGLASAAILMTYHNIAYMQRLMCNMQEAIKAQRFPDFVRTFLKNMFPEGNIRPWVVEALSDAGISVEDMIKPSLKRKRDDGDLIQEGAQGRKDDVDDNAKHNNNDKKPHQESSS